MRLRKAAGLEDALEARPFLSEELRRVIGGLQLLAYALHRERPKVRPKSGKFLLSILIIWGIHAQAQSAGSANVEQGVAPYASVNHGDFDVVDLATGNLNVSIPLWSLPQRGEVGLSFSLRVLSGKNWQVQDTHPVSSTHIWGYVGRGVIPVRDQLVRHNDQGQYQSAILADGSEHVFGKLSNGVGQSVDATGIALLPGIGTCNPPPPGTETCGGPIITREGIVNVVASIFGLEGFTPRTYYEDTRNSYMQDRNGNRITVTDQGWVDTLGRLIQGSPDGQTTTDGINPVPVPPGTSPFLRFVTEYLFPGVQTSDFSKCASGTSLARLWTLPTPPGATGPSAITFCFTPVALQTAFNWPNVQESIPGTVPFLTRVVLADGGRYDLEYNSYGDVTKITLPTGGTISYQWASLQECGDIWGPTRFVTARIVDANNGAGPQPWSFNYDTSNILGGPRKTTVLDPLGNESVHSFSPLASVDGCSLAETEVQRYQGSRALLQTIDTSFNLAAESPWWENSKLGPRLMNTVPTDIKTKLSNGLVSETRLTYDPGDQFTYPSQPAVSFLITHGSLTQKQNYDYGQGGPGLLLRSTTTNFQWQTDPNYKSANLLDLPASLLIADGQSGNTCSETDYFYDEPGYLTTPNPAVTTQHVSPLGPVRGNPTTVKRRLTASPCAANPTWTDIPTHTNWYDTGEPHLKMDPLGHTTTLTYDPFYVNAYVTQTCSPSTNSAAHCVSGTYDLNTGLLTSFTNENASTQASGNTPGDSAHTSTYQYDLMFRPAQALAPPDPDPANGGAQAQTTLTYSDTTAPNSFPLTLTLQKSVTTTLTDSATSTYDGVGRVYKTEHAMPSGNPARVDTVFDGTGRIKSVSNPYFVTTDPTYGTTETHYDALDRPFWIKEQDGSLKQLSYDVNTSPSVAGDCMVAIDEIGNQRGTCFDALGRLVEVDEPATAGVPVQNNYVTMQTDGNFVLYSSSNNALWSTGTAGTNAGPIMMQDDGNLVLYIFKWSAGVYAAPSPGPFPVATCSIGSYLVAGQTIPSGKCLSSPHGQYFLYMSPDGNFYIYDYSQGHGTWGANVTIGHPGAYALLQMDGNFVVNDVNGVTLWSSGTAGTYSERLDMEDDGRIILYKSAWSSGTSTGQFNWTQLVHPTCDVGTGTGWTGILWTGQCFVSPNGHYEMLLQPDGNLVLYDRSISTAPVPSAAIWSTGTAATLFSSSANLRTLYNYDALGNLTCVEQHGNVQPGAVGATGCSSDPSLDATSLWRVRRFTYDSLSRLLTARNPESGTISYSYDADGNLLQKTSPAPNQTGTATQTISYCYDELHRVTGKAYSAQTCQGTQLPAGTAAVSYTYDSGPNAKGKLTGITDQAGSASYSYDALGRLTSETRTIAGVPKTVSYEYNLDGSLKTLHYPSGSAVSYTPDSAGRILSAVDSGNSINYVTGAAYQADGQMTGFISGNGGAFAGVTNSFSYNKRLQPMNMAASSPSQTVFSIAYEFHAGNGTTGSGSDNGNVWNIYNYRDRTRDQSFNYDPLNRLTSAQNAGTDCTVQVLHGNLKFWGDTYTYDPWGNLTNKTKISTACAGELLNVTVGPDNRISSGGYVYDAAGNMTSDPTDGVTASYDPENRIASAATPLGNFAYIYDADGNRVEKITVPPPPATPTTGTLYWYMTPGIVAESDLAGNLKSEYVFFNGERVARRDFPAGSVAYYFSDHLKTASVITDSAGNITAESDYYPWGGELQFVANDSNHYKFTGKERDSETGLDYFGARYYSNGLGRFITPDWAAKATAVPYAEFSDPQSLNLYTYVRNIPTARFDADGHQNDCGYLCTLGQDVKAFFNAPDDFAKSVALHNLTHDLLGGEKLPASGQLQNTNAPTTPPEIPTNAMQILGSGEQDRTSSDNLRRDANGNPIPDPEAEGVAHSQLGTKTSQSQSGNPQYQQAMEYDADGNPVRRIDFTDHGRSDHPNPHQHVIDPRTGKIGPKEPLPPTPAPPPTPPPKPPPPPPPPKEDGTS